MRADRGLHPARQGDAVLAHEILDLERLPAVWIGEGDVRVRDDQGRVDGLVIGCDVRVRFVGPVRHAVVEDGLCDAVTHRGRQIAVRRGERRRIRIRVHDHCELRKRLIAADGFREARGEDPVGRVADGLGARPGDVAGVVLLLEEVARRRRVVRRPCVPHRDREVEEVASVHRRVR